MITQGRRSASFRVDAGGRSHVEGSLHSSTVRALLDAGQAAIEAGQAGVIDLKGVTDSDSAGLGLLIEWLSVAKAGQRELHYANIPQQIRELAHLSDVEELLEAS